MIYKRKYYITKEFLDSLIDASSAFQIHMKAEREKELYGLTYLWQQTKEYEDGYMITTYFKE